MVILRIHTSTCYALMLQAYGDECRTAFHPDASTLQTTHTHPEHTHGGVSSNLIREGIVRQEMKDRCVGEKSAHVSLKVNNCLQESRDEREKRIKKRIKLDYQYCAAAWHLNVNCTIVTVLPFFHIDFYGARWSRFLSFCSFCAYNLCKSRTTWVAG